MKTRTKTPRRGTLTDDPTTAKIKGALAAQGFKTLSAAAESVGFGVSRLVKLIHHGVSPNPSARTMDRLHKLGIADMVRRR